MAKGYLGVMKLIVGLGNPGQAYADNRHNVGFQCLNHFARVHKLTFSQQQSRCRIGFGEVGGFQVIIAKPRTFMNLSGQAVKQVVQRYNIALNDLIIIHDDLDLPIGKIRIRQQGSSGGHKGMQSIIEHLGGQDFPRIRVGISRPAEIERPSQARPRVMSYVLSDFTAAEKAIMKEVYARVSDAIECILSQGLTEAMNKYN